MIDELDRIDRKILVEMQQDGRLSNIELSRRVNLSPTPCLERIKRLEKKGYIRGYNAILDATKLKRGLLVFVQIVLDRTTHDVFELFAKSVKNLPQVQECHMVAGGFDYLLKLRFENMQSYRSFLGDHLSNFPGVSQTHTYIAMEEIKSSSQIEIELLP